MKKYCLITTYYCKDCPLPSKEFVKNKFNYDGNLSDLFINFSNEFDPFNTNKIIPIGNSKRKDLVFGKIFLLKRFIEQNILNEYEYLIHIDYSDTKFSRSCNDMIDKFIDSNQEFIISTEKNCWPYLDVVSSWLQKKLEPKEFFYLNSGGIISKVDKFYNILKSLEELCLTTEIDFWDDQGVWQYFDLMKENLKKDYNSEYFFSTALLDESYYSITNNKIKTKFETYPYLIHDNSSFSLNLINKI